MCGIVGYTGTRPVVDVLLKGLQRLEYRGYDSAGIAFWKDNKIEIRKSEGKLENVEKLIASSRAQFAGSTAGIGHTRWATHGKPTTQNAHPHRTGPVVLVHNGIIENYQEIKQRMIFLGHQPQSETDSELFGFLVQEKLKTIKELPEAVRQAFLELDGSCSVVVMSDDVPGMVIGVRNGTPLVAAVDPQGGSILASDAQPLLEYTRDVVFMENGDYAVATPKGMQFFDLKTGKGVQRPTAHLDWSPDRMDKGGYPHYMLKEIYEQPTALVDTLNGLLDRAKSTPFVLAEQPGVALLRKAKAIRLIACGTSWHASLLGKYWIERWARIPVEVELASEFRYRDPVINADTLVIGLSQSGETADTLAVIRDMRKRGIPTLTVTNVRGSTLSREAEAAFFTSAGPEIGVAATKTFTSQLMVLLLIAGYLGMHNGHQVEVLEQLFHDLLKMPHMLKDSILEDSPLVQAVHKASAGLFEVPGFFFMGRGFSFPIALEGALKLKEIAYTHAEGYAAGELKHGPIAMIDEQMAVVVIAPPDSWREKSVSNLEEVKARGARIVSIGAASDTSLKSLSEFWIPLPASLSPAGKHAVSETWATLMPFMVCPAIQLLSYEIAVKKGTDVDKPRNLAKSVTVE